MAESFYFAILKRHLPVVVVQSLMCNLSWDLDLGDRPVLAFSFSCVNSTTPLSWLYTPAELIFRQQMVQKSLSNV